MPKLESAVAGALTVLILSSCGGQAPEAAENASVAAGPNGLENSTSADPEQPAMPDNSSAEPVPPPDAVSHPNGYLPPAPAEPEAPAPNSSSTDPSPPATEDQYIRNGQ